MQSRAHIICGTSTPNDHRVHRRYPQMKRNSCKLDVIGCLPTGFSGMGISILDNPHVSNYIGYNIFVIVLIYVHDMHTPARYGL